MNYRPTQSIYVAIFIALLFACSSSTEADNSAVSDSSPLKISYIEGDDGSPLAKLLIDGMTCEKMCVSKVKATMAAVPGVVIQEMIFDPENAIDTLVIRYEVDKVNQETMVRAINDIAGGGVYRVKELQLSKDPSSSVFIEQPKKKTKRDRNKVRTQRYSVPNIFDALRKVGL